MSYKQKSPFNSFRDPKRTVRNFKPTEFKMPDLSPIVNKTSDGIDITDDRKNDNEGEKGKGPLADENHAMDQINKNKEAIVEKQKPEHIKIKERYAADRAQEKAVFKQIRKNARLADKKTTAEEKDRFTRDKIKMQEYKFNKSKAGRKKEQDKIEAEKLDEQRSKFNIGEKIEPKNEFKFDLMKSEEPDLKLGGVEEFKKQNQKLKQAHLLERAKAGDDKAIRDQTIVNSIDEIGGGMGEIPSLPGPYSEKRKTENRMKLQRYMNSPLNMNSRSKIEKSGEIKRKTNSSSGRGSFKLESPFAKVTNEKMGLPEREESSKDTKTKTKEETKSKEKVTNKPPEQPAPQPDPPSPQPEQPTSTAPSAPRVNNFDSSEMGSLEPTTRSGTQNAPKVDPPKVDPPEVEAPKVDPPTLDPPKVDTPTQEPTGAGGPKAGSSSSSESSKSADETSSSTNRNAAAANTTNKLNEVTQESSTRSQGTPISQPRSGTQGSVTQEPMGDPGFSSENEKSNFINSSSNNKADQVAATMNNSRSRAQTQQNSQGIITPTSSFFSGDMGVNKNTTSGVGNDIKNTTGYSKQIETANQNTKQQAIDNLAKNPNAQTPGAKPPSQEEIMTNPIKQPPVSKAPVTSPPPPPPPPVNQPVQGQNNCGNASSSREAQFLNNAMPMFSTMKSMGPNKALQGDQHKLPEHLKKAIYKSPGMYDNV